MASICFHVISLGASRSWGREVGCEGLGRVFGRLYYLWIRVCWNWVLGVHERDVVYMLLIPCAVPTRGLSYTELTSLDPPIDFVLEYSIENEDAPSIVNS